MNSSELAKLIVAEFFGSGNTYLFTCLVVILASSAAFFVRYLERKAENYVTREDFQLLQEQLERSTRIVESIKAEVQHSDWARREWFTIQSKKLEELTAALNKLMTVVNDLPAKVRLENIGNYSEEINSVITLTQLYFPELLPGVEPFLNDVVKFVVYMHEMRISHLKNEPVDWSTLVSGSNHKNLINGSRGILREIANVLRQSAIGAGLLKSTANS
jgi:hypothetical protein